MVCCHARVLENKYTQTSHMPFRTMFSAVAMISIFFSYFAVIGPTKVSKIVTKLTEVVMVIFEQNETMMTSIWKATGIQRTQEMSTTPDTPLLHGRILLATPGPTRE